jgi:phosphoglucosamine mutase
MDNGIKVFSGNGFKLPDSHELAIEQEIFSLLRDPGHHNDATAKATPTLPGDAGLRAAYIGWLKENISADLSGLRVLVDCANGAAAVEAPEVFRACHVHASFMHASPDGKNINKECGALHPENVAQSIGGSKGAFDLGITFDGDADRALLSDAAGHVVNGDGVLLLAARDMKARGVLRGNTIVATTMSNMGLEIALRNSGIGMQRANVGDKYVLEEMLKTGATLGGEQSGHVIFRDGEATTGDGLLTALRVMEIMARTGRSLAELISDLKVFPQRIQNIRVREKVAFEQIPEVKRAIEAAQRELEGKGRVVVRYSGTEALARVMVEAESEERMNALTDGIAGAIKALLGA